MLQQRLLTCLHNRFTIILFSVPKHSHSVRFYLARKRQSDSRQFARNFWGKVKGLIVHHQTCEIPRNCGRLIDYTRFYSIICLTVKWPQFFAISQFCSSWLDVDQIRTGKCVVWNLSTDLMSKGPMIDICFRRSFPATFTQFYPFPSYFLKAKRTDLSRLDIKSPKLKPLHHVHL